MYKYIMFFVIASTISYGYAEPFYPKDVSDFIVKRDQCDHFRGEISGDPEIDGARNLLAELNKYCEGTDKILVSLKTKYKKNSEVINKLLDYEENIEPKETEEDLLLNQYPIKIYEGSIQYPKGYTNNDGIWRDELGKLVAPPIINFSGKYYIELHSCGTECRYYSLIDLSNKNDYSDQLKRFSTLPESSSQDSDSIELFYKADSRLLIVRYYNDVSDTYKDHLFLFEKEKIVRLNTSSDNCSKN